MMAAIHLQIVDGIWDPCASKLFFSGMEYDAEVEEIAMKRRSVEIDQLFEQKVLKITVDAKSPKEVEETFLKDLGELVLRANEKMHIVTVNNKFAPTKFVTLEEFLKKHGGSSNDTVRDLYTELSQFFLSRQIWEQDQVPKTSDIQKPKAKAKAKSKTAAKKAIVNTAEAARTAEGNPAEAASEAEGNPAEAARKAEGNPAQVAAANPAQVAAGNPAEVMNQTGKAMETEAELAVTEAGTVTDTDTDLQFCTPKKTSPSQLEVTPHKLEDTYHASNNTFYDVTDICNVDGPCMLHFTKDEQGYTQTYFLKLGQPEDRQFRGSDVLVLLSHPELGISHQEPGQDDVSISFQVHDETKVVVDWGQLDKKSPQLDSLSAVILKATKHKLQVALDGYVIAISEPQAALEEPSTKKRKTQLVTVTPCQKNSHVTGPEAFMIMMDELFLVKAPGFAFPWYFKAVVSDAVCTFKLCGIAVTPVGKPITLSSDKPYVIALSSSLSEATDP